MSDLTLGFLAIGLMLAFIVLGMHIGVALIVTSFAAVWVIRSPEIARRFIELGTKRVGIQRPPWPISCTDSFLCQHFSTNFRLYVTRGQLKSILNLDLKLLYKVAILSINSSLAQVVNSRLHGA